MYVHFKNLLHLLLHMSYSHPVMHKSTLTSFSDLSRPTVIIIYSVYHAV